MKTLNVIIGLSLGLALTGCPGDDGGEEEGGGTAATDTGTSTTTDEPGTTTEAEDTTTTDTPGTTTEAEDTTTTDEPGTTTDEPGTTTDETTTGEPALSFAVDVYPIIDMSCGCHTGGAAGGLPMPDAATAYANLVDVPSANAANDEDRVEPGDPTTSFLWQKVNWDLPLDPGEGDHMPLNGIELDQAELDIIEQWITEGALP